MDRLKGIAGGMSISYGSRNRVTAGGPERTGEANRSHPGQGTQTARENSQSFGEEGPGVSQSAGTQAVQNVSQSAGTQVVQNVLQSTGTQAVQNVSQSAGTQAVQSVSQSAGTQAVQNVSQSAGTQAAQNVSQSAAVQESQKAIRQDGTAEIQNAWLPFASQGGQSVRQADVVQKEEKIRPGWHRPPRASAKRYGSRNPYRMGEQDETQETQKANAKDQETNVPSKAKKEEEARNAWVLWKEAEEKRRKEEEEESNSFLNKLKQQAEAFKRAMDPKNQKNLYDATMDLTLLSQIEKIPGLKAMQSRLMFQIRSVKASGAENSEIRAAVTKLKKVIGKVKAKVKSLEKEALMEKKRKRAQEARRKAKERALRRELEWRRKARKAKEQKDIEESKMGLGANYGGPTGDPALDIAMEAYASMDSAAMAMDAGAVVDVAVADVGAAPVDGGAVAGAVDVSL